DGWALENLLAETIGVTVTRDAQSGGVTPGREQITLIGQAAQTDPLAYDWPRGSGASLTLVAVPPANGSGSLLANGDFESFPTTNIPDNWHLDAGTAGADVLRSTDRYDGSYALQLVGGPVQTAVYQDLGVDTGSTRPSPQTVYHACLWLKVTGSVTAGVLEVALTDGTGLILNDDAGRPNQATQDLVPLGSTYTPWTATFRLPRVLPTAVRLRLRLSTALSSGCSVLLDRITLAKASPLYVGGPYVTAHAGVIPFVTGDSWTITTTNTPGGFQRLFDRLFGMKALGLMLPSATGGAETISDSLIA
ncbi:MAG: hypothetical protein IRY99_18855, partial [Isosphaeraceae bacterium]|nr:hypothetical protein [Isosphaeraceae bacterium]